MNNETESRKTQQEINRECYETLIRVFGYAPMITELSGDDRKKFIEITSKMNEC